MPVPWHNCTQEHTTSRKLGHPLSTEGSVPLDQWYFQEPGKCIINSFKYQKKNKNKILMTYNNNINPDFICLYTNVISTLNVDNYVEEMHLK